MARVVLENVFKIYPDGVTAVKNANLEIHDREFMVLVGPSGCGKSTTLRMIAGLEEASRGTIYIDGQRVNDVPPKNRDIAMVFQNYALYPHMTVEKNMAFGLKLRRFPKVEIQQRVHEASEILGIKNLLHRKPKELSGGQRQRVAVGRAIVRKPKAFLFDEPLSNLDAKMRVQMRAEIKKLHTRLSSTMIYVTHDQVEAMTMGDRITVMKDGVIHQVASPLELYDNPINQFVAGFIGSPPMNFLEGRIARQNGTILFVDSGFALLVEPDHARKLESHIGKEIVLGIRPEYLKDSLHVTNPNPGHQLDARVDVVEQMGSEVYLYLTAGNSTFTARIGAHQPPTVNQDLKLVISMKKAQFFHKESGNILV